MQNSIITGVLWTDGNYRIRILLIVSRPVKAANITIQHNINHLATDHIGATHNVGIKLIIEMILEMIIEMWSWSWIESDSIWFGQNKASIVASKRYGVFL